MPGSTIGEAWVVIRPETTAFTSELQGGLAPGLATAAKAFVALGAVAVGVGVIAVKMAGDFQQATTQLITGAGESVKNIAMIRAGLLAMAPAVGVGPVALAKALYMIESAGYHGAAGLHLLQIAAEGAKVGNADLTVVADALTSALNAYHLPASAAVSVTNQIIAAVSVGKVHMQDFATAIGAILAPAAAANISFAEVSAAISTMTMQGTQADRASQSLRFVIASLQGPTAAAAKEMAALGVGEKQIPGITAAASAELAKLGLHTSEVAYTLTHQGLAAALAQITDAIGRQFPAGSAQYNAALRAATGGTRGFTAALELTGANAATFVKNTAAVAAAALKGGGAVAGWALVQQDFNQKMAVLGAAVQVVAIRLGTFLLPIVSAVAASIIPVVSSVTKWVTGLTGLWNVIGILGPGIVVVIAALAAWATATLAVAAATKIAAIAQGLFNLVMLANPISIVIVAIVALVAGFVILYTHVTGFRNVVNAVFAVVVSIIKSALSVIVAISTVAWHVVSTIVGAAINVIVAVVKAVEPPIAAVLGFIVGIWKFEWNVVSTIVGTAITVIVAVIKGIIAAVTAVINFLKGPLGAAFGAIGAVGKAVFGGIATAIGWVINAIGTLIGWIRTAIGWFTSLGNASGSAVRPPGSPIIGRRAAGGPVEANVPYWIGENGPEIFKPRTAGVVIPTSALTSGGGTSAIGAASSTGSGGIVQHNYFTGITRDHQHLIESAIQRNNRTLILALKAR